MWCFFNDLTVGGDDSFLAFDQRLELRRDALGGCEPLHRPLAVDHELIGDQLGVVKLENRIDLVTRHVVCVYRGDTTPWTAAEARNATTAPHSATVRPVSIPPTLFSEEEIASRVAAIATEIDDAYADADLLVLIGVLKGSFIFLADLARKLTIPHRIEFIAVSSYGTRASETADSVRLLMDVRHPIVGEHVLLVEDIVDTGHTIAYLKRLLGARDPASLKTCTLLHKPDRTEEEVELDFLGFTIPDVWVVGYGLDFAERYRTLPYIGELPPEMR